MDDPKDPANRRIKKDQPYGGQTGQPKPYGGSSGAKDAQIEDPETYQGSVLAKLKKPQGAPDTEAQPKQNPGEPLGAYAARVRKWRDAKKDGTQAGQEKALGEMK